VAAPAKLVAVKCEARRMQRKRDRGCCTAKERREREVAWVMGLARAVVDVYWSSMLDGRDGLKARARTERQTTRR
jgi:hypothetical protein